MLTKIEIIKQSVSMEHILTLFNLKTSREHFICCPFHHEKTPSMKIYKNGFKCYGCGEHGDVIDFTAKINGTTNNEAMRFLSDTFGLDLYTELTQEQKREYAKKMQELEKRKTEPIKEFVVPEKNKLEIKQYILNCNENVNKTDYFHKRGFTDYSIKRFNLGYDINRNSVVVPYNRKLDYYQSRSIIDKKFFKPKSNYAGKEPLYNQAALYTENPVFIVESPFCAMSIMQCGGYAISICGTAGVTKLAKIIKNKKPLGKLILCLDNDEAGKRATEKLIANINCEYLIANIADECKDPNELLQLDENRLKQNISKLI